MNPQTTYPMPAQGSGKNKALIVLAVLLLLAILFGVWAYSTGQSYKSTNTKDNLTTLQATQKATAAQAALDKELKTPLKTYTGSATYGSISFNYPKNWSAYVDETSSDQPINGYFHPDKVPAVQSSAAFALRVELVSGAYSDIVSGYQSKIKEGSIKAAAYVPPKLVGVANVQPGLRLDGAISQDEKAGSGSMVIIKVRDKTLKIYTQSTNFSSDFNNTVLPSLNFTP